MTTEKQQFCKAGLHDLNAPGASYVRPNGKRTCRACKNGKTQAAYLRRKRAGLVTNQPEDAMTPGQVDAFLERAVANETAMPWERHPQPWDMP